MVQLTNPPPDNLQIVNPTVSSASTAISASLSFRLHSRSLGNSCWQIRQGFCEPRIQVGTVPRIPRSATRPRCGSRRFGGGYLEVAMARL
nr:hypothetical protein CFP56_26278 [Quercus suber]